jgi:hypothetical protein
MNKLNKLYDNLSNDERIKLFIEAMARKDEFEVDRLEETCPRATYRMPDYQYTRHKTGAMMLSCFNVMDSYRSITYALFSLALLYVADNHDESIAENDLENTVRLWVTKFKANEQAWHEFCVENGLDPQTMRQAFVIRTPWDDELFKVLDPILVECIPSREEVERLKAELNEMWNK